MAPKVRISRVQSYHILPQIKQQTPTAQCNSIDQRNIFIQRNPIVQRTSTVQRNNKQSINQRPIVKYPANAHHSSINSQQIDDIPKNNNYFTSTARYNRPFEARLPTLKEKTEIDNELRKIKGNYYKNYTEKKEYK